MTPRKTRKAATAFLYELTAYFLGGRMHLLAVILPFFTCVASRRYPFPTLCCLLC